MSRHYHRLSLACWLPLSFIRLAFTTTIVEGNTTVAATTANIALAAELVAGDLLPAEALQLTENVLANLTTLSLTDISLFEFSAAANSSAARSTTTSGGCKVFPGDTLWPDDTAWSLLDLLTGGALIKTTPLASVCYDGWGNYDAEQCAYVTDQWTNSSLHTADPTSVMSPIFQGLTCLPSGGADPGNCTMGGYPSYALNITSTAQVQLAVNFARNQDLRLVVKNTGHDFIGRSSGAGALSIWTHHLKDLEFFDDYTTSDYLGPAVRVGAGVQGFELYDFAHAHGVVAVGGEGRTVGFAGGYIAGGGHSPLSSLYGMAADQILSVNLVTPDGRFATADENENVDLFWALRGGGGSTFGVVTSYTVKVHPEFSAVTYMDLTIAATGNVTEDMFWAAFDQYLLFLPTAIDAGNYEYWFLMNVGYPELIFSPWFAPGMTVAEFQNFTAPLFEKWSKIGLSLTPSYYQYDNFLDAYNAGFPQETIGTNNTKDASRLIPRENLVDTAKFNVTSAAIREFYDAGGMFVGAGTTGGPPPSDLNYHHHAPDNAVNPAWRAAALQLIPCRFWTDENGTNGTNVTTMADIAAYSEELSTAAAWMPIIRDATPGAGGYHSEGDANEPDFQASFYGRETYDRLLGVKERYDPAGLFYAHKGVGSDAWYVTGQLEGLPTQNGRLCRVMSSG